MTGLIVAIDTVDLLRAQLLVSLLRPHVDMIKIGSGFFSAHGPDGVRKLDLPGSPWMLDLKWHDIPSTVVTAVRAVLPLQPTFVTVHADGGRRMIEMACNMARKFEDGPKIIAVTTLTSVLAKQGDTLNATRDAEAAGADGLVCPARHVAAVRANVRDDTILICPGVRPRDIAVDDHIFSITPSYAAGAGADYVVVGRPIALATNPATAADAIVAELNRKPK